MNWSGSKRPSALLGLAFDGDVVHAAVVDRPKHGGKTTASGPVVTSFAWTLSETDPAASGRRLREQLDTAHLREKRCAVALPSAWIMTVPIALPDLSPADAESFIELEAERGFPSELSELQIARSLQRVGDQKYVTLLGVRREWLTRLSTALTAAGLRPVSFTCGPAALPDAIPADGNGLASLLLGADEASLLLTSGGGICALRTLSTGDGQEALLSRDVRISYEELPPALRARLRRLRLFGSDARVTALAGALSSWSDAAGFRIERAGPAGPGLATAVAARHLATPGELPEFLPPRASRWGALNRLPRSRRLSVGLLAGAAVLLILIAAYGWREYEAWSLRSRWSAMQGRVQELDGIQARIREFRPWHDTSYRTLNTLRLVTEVFPENGTVTAKTFEIRGQTNVTVTGTTRDNATLLQALDKLRQRREVTNLKIDQIRGKSPAQFTFNFQLARTPGS